MSEFQHVREIDRGSPPDRSIRLAPALTSHGGSFITNAEERVSTQPLKSSRTVHEVMTFHSSTVPAIVKYISYGGLKNFPVLSKT